MKIIGESQAKGTERENRILFACLSRTHPFVIIMTLEPGHMLSILLDLNIYLYPEASTAPGAQGYSKNSEKRVKL